MTTADYHADRSRVSASSLKLFARAPSLWWDWRNGSPSRPTTPALLLGKLVHTLALEPAEFSREFFLVPADAPNRPSSRQREAKKPSDETLKAIEWWDNFEAASKGKEVVESELFDKAEAIVASLQKDPAIGPFLRCRGEVEKTIHFTDEETGIECKARLDKLINPVPPIIFDIKTTADASADGFQRNAINYGYHIQAAHYAAAVEAETGAELSSIGFYFGTAETSDALLTHCFRASPEFLEFGRIERSKLMRRLAACLESGSFPGYCQAPEGVTELSLPGWAVHKLMEETSDDLTT